MSREIQDKMIEAGKLVLLIGASLGAFALGAHDLAMFIAGGALGHAMPGRRVIAGAAVALLAATTLTGCAAGGGADWGLIKGIVQTACGAADVLLPSGGRTSGGESSDEDEEPHTIDEVP